MNTLVINKNDLIHNINVIKNQVSNQEYTIIGVVKGNGYGLGLKEYSNILIESGIKILATATAKEAIDLRNINKDIEILNMSATAIKEEMQELIQNNITVVIGSKQDAEIANEIAEERQKN